MMKWMWCLKGEQARHQMQKVSLRVPCRMPLIGGLDPVGVESRGPRSKQSFDFQARRGLLDVWGQELECFSDHAIRYPIQLRIQA